jgi:3-hydroxybutyryl-CoA dehydratase
MRGTMKGSFLQDLEVGQTAETSKKITETDLSLFAAVTGDFNPAHFDPVYASGTRFKERIAHGMIMAGLISGVIGMKLPGPGTIYLKQSLNFLVPVKLEDVITARVEIIEILEKRRVRLLTKCINQEGVTVVEGEALVIAPPRAV